MIWQEYGLDRLQEGIAVLFPKSGLSARALLGQVLQGDIAGSGSRAVFGLWGQLKFPFSGHEKYFYLASHSGNCFLSDESFY